MEKMNRNQKIDVDNNVENKTIIRYNFFNRLRNDVIRKSTKHITYYVDT